VGEGRKKDKKMGKGGMYVRSTQRNGPEWVSLPNLAEHESPTTHHHHHHHPRLAQQVRYMAAQRTDGRAPDDLRELTVSYDGLNRVDGSARFSFGAARSLFPVAIFPC
jgi:hypothetical protein